MVGVIGQPSKNKKPDTDKYWALVPIAGNYLNTFMAS